MKNAVFWNVAMCRPCVNRRFGGIYRLHLQGRKIHERETSVSRWLQTELSLQPPAIKETYLHMKRSASHGLLTEFISMVYTIVLYSKLSIYTFITI
jgi:hypothetical protein